jgi:FG-GAP repeat protein
MHSNSEAHWCVRLLCPRADSYCLGPPRVVQAAGCGTASFGAATNLRVGNFPDSVAVGDFNGDGKLDLAVADENSNDVSMLLGSGTGNFGAPRISEWGLLLVPWRSGTSPATAHSTSRWPMACVGDCDQDGSVTVEELLRLVKIALGRADLSACRAGDANGDSQITLNEILSAVNSALNGCGQGRLAS